MNLALTIRSAELVYIEIAPANETFYDNLSNDLVLSFLSSDMLDAENI